MFVNFAFVFLFIFLVIVVYIEAFHLKQWIALVIKRRKKEKNYQRFCFHLVVLAETRQNARSPNRILKIKIKFSVRKQKKKKQKRQRIIKGLWTQRLCAQHTRLRIRARVCTQQSIALVCFLHKCVAAGYMCGVPYIYYVNAKQYLK